MADIARTRLAVGHLRQAAEHLAHSLQQLIEADRLAVPHIYRAGRHHLVAQALYQQRYQIVDVEEVAGLLAIAEDGDRPAGQGALGEDADHPGVHQRQLDPAR